MYSSGAYIIDPVGNNEFSYNERIALGSLGKIFVPSLIQGNVDDLEVGSEICFEEAENGKLISCTGLKHFIKTSLFATEGNPVDKEGEGDSETPVYIVDNHNHALSFRSNARTLIHIDQHSDTKENNSKFNIQNAKLNEIEDFVNEKTNVGNFISAAVNSGIVDEVIQVRTDYALKKILNSEFRILNYILDIDIDFRVDKELTPEDIQIIRKLMKKAKLVTIATSPYFMDQKRAIEIIKAILQ